MAGRVCRLLLRLLGWQVVLVPPPSAKTVIIGYPHTSNWDFPVAMLWRCATGFPLFWVAKREMFANPLGGLFRRWGGIPLDRGRPEGFVEQVCAEFGRRAVFHLAIAPEGTRRHTDHWKSGFYRIAVAAQVPLGLGFLDWGRRQLGIGAWIALSGDRDTDLARIRAFYADKRGCRPQQAGDIRFRD
ncbi:1-acyl-sn-glycerol-3-phosphate acyltransferase [Azospira restricta]|uniref:1-acyl-sn-glycerol-3-phosphate acyltransferase n=1 Tax=Azospira restricta TaxID=404405 RepID=A0A974SQ53_9RHOO|nr:1-acyl-sn-glycerol-3-phosphate acyltransferase [Azospira restricta]QRJ64456.1 1-acyl-sn-glycerol-3-phosphate acyltransferase [Azospira restricta]